MAVHSAGIGRTALVTHCVYNPRSASLGRVTLSSRNRTSGSPPPTTDASGRCPSRGVAAWAVACRVWSDWGGAPIPPILRPVAGGAGPPAGGGEGHRAVDSRRRHVAVQASRPDLAVDGLPDERHARRHSHGEAH